VHSIVQKLKGLTGGLWIISNKMNREMMIRIITAQVFSILYYGCQLWLTPSLSYNNIKKIESVHYAALRVSIKDRKRKTKRDFIDHATRRMAPKLWMKYSATSLYIKIIRDCMPTRLRSSLLMNTYQENRKGTPLPARVDKNHIETGLGPF